jgi:hypothetical protein
VHTQAASAMINDCVAEPKAPLAQGVRQVFGQALRGQQHMRDKASTATTAAAQSKQGRIADCMLFKLCPATRERS